MADEDKKFPLDDLVSDVESKTSIRDGVKTLVEKLAQEFEVAAIDGNEAAEKFAKDVTARAGDLAGAVEAILPKPEAPAAGMQAPKMGAGKSTEELEAEYHSEPHNEAAAAAVATGMDTKTANLMTAPGSNT